MTKWDDAEMTDAEWDAICKEAKPLPDVFDAWLDRSDPEHPLYRRGLKSVPPPPDEDEEEP